MKEVIIASPPELDEKKERIVDLHSLFNVLNVVSVSLEITSMAAPVELRKAVDAHREEIQDLVSTLRLGEPITDLPIRLSRLSETILNDVTFLSQSMEKGEDREDVVESLNNLRSIFAILETRLKELLLRKDDPDRWIRINTDEFLDLFKDVFFAIENNARGRYRIVFNLARKNSEDYYIDLNVESDRAGKDLLIPLRLIDVLRDLTANARKYTNPGGKVALAVYQNDQMIHAVIEDTGFGIPESELDRVIEFGYRASNVAERPTMGGGFGLTKAASLVPCWGGKMTLASALDEGTRIEIEIPCTGKEIEGIAFRN